MYLRKGGNIIFLLLFVYLLGCALWDWSRRRIPNWWTVLWWMVSGVCCVWKGDISLPAAIFTYLTSAILPAVIFFPLYMARMTGAGDIKMLSVITGAAGIWEGFHIIFFGLTAAAVWSFIYMVRRHILLKRIYYFLSYIKSLRGAEEIPPYCGRGESDREIQICLAPFIFAGYLLRYAVGGVL